MTNFLCVIGLSLSLLFFSGCNVEDPNLRPPKSASRGQNPNTGTGGVEPFNNSREQAPSTQNSAHRQSNPGVPAQRRGLIFKRAPVKKITARTRKNSRKPGTSEYRPRCGGIPSDVSPRVLQFLTCPVAQILSQPEWVASFKLEPDADPSVPLANRLGQFPIKAEGQGRNLEGADLNTFKKLVFSEHSYHFGMEKRCHFSPEFGLHFVKGDEAVEVLFSQECQLWSFVHGEAEDEKIEDFDPIQSQLKFLQSLFPRPDRPTTPNVNL